MRIVIFSHPGFLNSQSMPKYAQMLADGMRARNHIVELWSPQAFFYKIPSPPVIKKWFGYIDSLLVFPLKVRLRLKSCLSDTLFVFADQALGPWIPLVANRPHVIHCHDFIAQRSALGEIPENGVGITGKIYQAYIRRGFRRGTNFVSISMKTREDLHRFLEFSPPISEVVYNGLNQEFSPGDADSSRKDLEENFGLKLQKGFILHIGGNQFNKNKKGILKIYNSWRRTAKKAIPLVFVGPPQDEELEELVNRSSFLSDIHFVTNASDNYIKLFYRAATVLLFPSLDEGFGWPIAEAMASGCPVITTNAAPMNEVGGSACLYLPQFKDEPQGLWEEGCAQVLNKVIEFSPKERQDVITAGLHEARRYNTLASLDQIESIYLKTLAFSFSLSGAEAIEI